MPTKRFKNLEPERRKSILAAAQNEFIKNGYDSASLNTIIAEAGISKGSLYYYFEDKSDLYLTVLNDVMAGLQHNIGGIGSGEFSDDFWKDIEDYTRKSLRMIKENPDFVRLARGLFSLISSGNIPESVADVFNDWKSMMTEIVVHGQEVGEIRNDLPLDLLVNILWSIGESVDYWVFSHIDEFSADESEQMSHIYIELYKKIAAHPAAQHKKESKK
ncbi:TetR/AcrR family transcriptional regulator [Candidatus Latescibacterota bacterium]